MKITIEADITEDVLDDWEHCANIMLLQYIGKNPDFKKSMELLIDIVNTISEGIEREKTFNE